jgi:hypothetical protein
LTIIPFRAGQFVWTAYPESEDPLSPGPEHIGYIFMVSAASEGFVAYTTSRPWFGEKPSGIHVFDQAAAAEMGQDKAFVLDLRRIALLPLTVRWFPRLNTPGHGIVGQAPEKIREELETAAREIFRRRPEIVERLGPGWKKG